MLSAVIIFPPHFVINNQNNYFYKMFVSLLLSCCAPYKGAFLEARDKQVSSIRVMNNNNNLEKIKQLDR